MRTDILTDIERTIENGLEDNGIKSVEIGSNSIRVEVGSGRAFARMFPKAEERVARKDNYGNIFVEGFDNEYVFYIKFEYGKGYEEFSIMFPLTEIWVDEDEVEENA